MSPRFKRLAPYFLAGPISGPLLAGVVINFQRGNRLLGGLYGVALVQVTFLLPAIAAKLSLKVAYLAAQTG